MKKIFFILFAPVFLLFACKEIPPVINPQMNVDTDACELDIDVTDQTRHVLMEEFTGVRCVNCPSGSEVLEAIVGQYGEKVVAISIHAGSFSNPYAESQYNFQDTLTGSTEGLYSTLGPPIGYPAAVINRVFHNGSSRLPVINKDLWTGIVETELTKPLTVKLGIAHTFDSDSRLLEICTKIFPQEDITDEDVRISIFLTESDVVDLQETPEGKIPDYVHKHILRAAITAFDGNLITDPLTANSVVERSFTYTIPDYWIADNMEIIAVIHKGGVDKEVLQTVSKHL